MDVDKSQFLEEKRRIAFRFFDVTKDDLLTEEDLVQIAHYISTNTGASAEKAAKTKQEWLKWMKYLQPDPLVIVDEDRFVATCAELSRDMPNYHQLLRAWASDLFDSMDLNGDGEISFEELKVFYGAVGQTNEDMVSKVFHQLSSKGNSFLISREPFVVDIVRHMTSEDPKDVSVFIIVSN